MGFGGREVVITGTHRHYTRADLEAEIRKKGGTVGRKVTRNTSILFDVDGKSSGTTKTRDALKLSVPVADRAVLDSILAGALTLSAHLQARVDIERMSREPAGPSASRTASDALEEGVLSIAAEANTSSAFAMLF